MLTDEELSRKISNAPAPHVSPDLDAVRQRIDQRANRRRAVVGSVAACLAVVATTVGISALRPNGRPDDDVATQSPTSQSPTSPTAAPTFSPTTSASVPVPKPTGATSRPTNPVPTKPVTTSPAPGGRKVAAFFSPTANIACSMDRALGVWCLVLKTSYPASSCIPDQISTQLWLKEKAVREPIACVDEEHLQYVFGASAVNPPTTNNWLRAGEGAWWWRAGQPTARMTFWQTQYRHAVLQYGQSLKMGAYTCTSATTGVTCRNQAGRGFQVSRTVLRTF